MLYAAIVSTKKGIGITDVMGEKKAKAVGGTLIAFESKEDYEKTKERIGLMGRAKKGLVAEFKSSEEDHYISIPEDEKNSIKKLLEDQQYKTLMKKINEEGWSNLEWCCNRQRHYLIKLLKQSL